MLIPMRRIFSSGRFLVLTIEQRLISRKQTTSSNFVRFAEVGKLETPKLEGRYQVGQLFLHRVFGYRGVTLIPFTARVFDRDVPIEKNSEQLDDSAGFNVFGKDVRGHTHVYYLVLIDLRDCPFVRMETDGVSCLDKQLSNVKPSKPFFMIPGLDYVAHEDILPYTSTEKQPIQHQLFDKFLSYDPPRNPSFVPKDALIAWQEKNHPWLVLRDVHKETTEDLRVTVIPFYLGSRVDADVTSYWWRYSVRLENLSTLEVQLRGRHWRVFSIPGNLDNIQARGIIGQEPILTKLKPAFQYSSYVSLQSANGHMWGTFKMERQDGSTFDCRIPTFSLDSKPDSPNVTS